MNLPWLYNLPSCDSTNTWAKDHAPHLCHGDLVWAQQQTAGRGQQGRVWVAPPGSLTFSLVLDAAAPVLSGLSVGVGLAVLYALDQLLPHTEPLTYVKWPNDLYAQGRKLGGILIEAIHTTSLQPGEKRLIVGIGLNYNVDTSQTPQLTQAISLHHLCPTLPDPLVLLTQIRHSVLQAHSLIQRHSLAPLLPTLNQRHLLHRKQITVEQATQQLQGRVVGIRADGALELALAGGEQVAIYHGHIRFEPES